MRMVTFLLPLVQVREAAGKDKGRWSVLGKTNRHYSNGVIRCSKDRCVIVCDPVMISGLVS